jgi:alkanesulfonate monooxygenase SsuD/methylene tetrahydromethanopterin reductase-like flavin-dependent oxidoreductase (luciferase family)
MRTVRFGLSIPNFAEPRHLLDVARHADATGWDGFFLWDHVVVDPAAGPPISEPWTVLAAVAGVTDRVRIGTLVTPVARRRPWVLVRQVTAVDHLSGGRAVLGVGLGVPPEAEYAAVGESAAPRRHAALLDEGLQIIADAWTGEPVQHDGAHFHVTGVRFRPPPVQQPRPPIWVAAALPSFAGVRRAARWDGVAPIFSRGDEFRPVTPDEVRAIVVEGVACGAPDPWEVVVFTVSEDIEELREYEAAGATWLIEGPAPGDDWLDDALGMAKAGPPTW